MLPSLAHILCLLATWYCTESCQPLHLTPLIDQGNITAAQEISQVNDPPSIIPKSYAGFITTDRQRRNHLFFWFFPSMNESKAPLVVWLNGGPSISSMFGMLFENGPIRNRKLDSGEEIYERRPNSWAEPFSMLYIDNPVGVGYSYSETDSYKTTQDEYGEELYVFLEQFYQIFPEYFQRELYIGGQSYAGKYVPAFAHRIHRSIAEKKSRIPLTGIYLGGPYFDPLVQSAVACEYFYALGAASRSQVMTCKETVSQLKDRMERGDLDYENINEILDSAFPIDLMMDNFITQEQADYQGTENIMTRNDIQDALHVCNRTYRASSTDFRKKFSRDFLVSTKTKLAELMDNYKFLLFTGYFDAIVSAPMVEAALISTPWSLQEQYNNASRLMWKDDSTSRIQGFYTKIGKFCRVSVNGAGHQTPHDQPKRTLEMMTDFIQYGCVCPECRQREG